MARTLPSSTAGPEVGTLDPRRLDRLRRLGHLLDSAVRLPGTRFRFGLDSVIGLIPGVGDLVGGALSLYILLEAARMGVPRPLLVRMGYNILVDVLVGAVPLLGDLFDAGFKANLRNLALVQQHVEHPTTSRRASRRFAALLVLGLGLLLVGAVAAAVLLIRLLDRPAL